ncbi:unnamed protein product [Prorocentrum cordatum]|uniref:Uncharacterized protein n=1 Tax=Prorocentrum cordatum TaxID=2364126 RepID=A0ABN9PSM0_9DINO|nr:unnamed protein product [Polarella glacialis]
MGRPPPEVQDGSARGRAAILRNLRVIGRRCRARGRFADASTLGPLLYVEDLAAAVSEHLQSHEACALRATARAVRQGAWGSKLRSYVYAFGGECADTGHTERLRPETGAWEALPPMGQGRMWATGVAMQGCLFVCGGSHGLGPVDLVECFSPRRGCWSTLPPMKSRRAWASGGAIGGCLYICGGRDLNRCHSSAECFNPEVGEWEAVGNMRCARYGAAGAVVSGRLYVCGGFATPRHLAPNPEGPETSAKQFWGIDSVERFDAEVRDWAEMPPMRHRRGWSVAAAALGHVYMCGGRNEDGVLSSVERFMPELAPWETLPSMGKGRHAAIGAVVGGRIYVLGGRAGRSILRTSEVFDIAQGGWSPAPHMAEGRAWAVGAVLASTAGS